MRNVILRKLKEKKMYRYLLLLCAIFISFWFMTCRWDNEYDRWAEETCRCFEPMFTLEEEVQVAIKAGDEQRLKKLSRELEKKEERSLKCLEAWEEKRSSLSLEEQERLFKALNQQCFEVAAMLETENQ